MREAPHKTLLTPPEQLRKKRKNTGKRIGFFLLVLIILFEGIALWFLGRNPSKIENIPEKMEYKEKTQQVIPQKKGRPVSVAIHSQKETYVVLGEMDEKEGFYILHSDLPVEELMAIDLLKVGQDLRSNQSFIAEDLSSYGLAPEKIKAEFTYGDGSVVTLLLGDGVPTGEGVYGRISGQEEVFVFSKEIFEKINGGIERLVALPDLSAYTAPTILQTTIEILGEEPICVRRVIEENPFYTRVELVEPIQYPANADRAAELFQGVCSIVPEAFAGLADKEGALATYGLEPPLARIEIIGEDQQRCKMRVGMVEEKWYMTLEGEEAVYLLQSDHVDFLQNVKVSYVAEQLIGLVMLSHVKEVVVENKEFSWTLAIQRDEKGMETYTINEKQVEGEEFRKLYQRLISLLVDKQIENRIPSKAEHASFTYTFLDGEKWVLAFNEYDTLYYSVTRGGKTDFLMEKNKVHGVFEALEEFQ
ncbi:MAG: DUF4340 domain-containing protein [Clostridiales bacterium]|nr:DUF4340 domain-containing protein [Clostridiales bacterium]